MAQMAFNPNMIIPENNSTPTPLPNETSSSQILNSNNTSLTSNNLTDEANSLNNPISIFSNLLDRSALTSITSWQVKINLIEIRNLFGNHKKVYCVVKIADQMFKSSARTMDKLRFNEVGFHFPALFIYFKLGFIIAFVKSFTARIENVKLPRVMNKLITVDVYCKNMLRSDSLIGKKKSKNKCQTYTNN